MLTSAIHRNSAGIRSSERGLTLIEVAATIVVLTAVALGVALMIVPIARQSRINRETLTANEAARRILEEMQATPFNDIMAHYPGGSEQLISELPEGKLIVSYQDILADPLVIQLDLEWDSPDLGLIRRTFHTARTE